MTFIGLNHLLSLGQKHAEIYSLNLCEEKSLGLFEFWSIYLLTERFSWRQAEQADLLPQ